MYTVRIDPNVNRIETTRSALVAHTFRQKLTSGHMGVYAFSGDEVVGCFWAEPSGAWWLVLGGYRLWAP